MQTIDAVTVSKGLAILPGPRISFLDHLIPLCHHWNIPLLCTDMWVHTCAQTFYPSTEVILACEATFQEIVSSYETLVTVEPCRLHPRAFQFGSFLYQGEATTIAGFHGNPSKFREDYWIERYVHEDRVLLYGQHLIDYFKEKGAWSRLKQTALMGNRRKAFYEKHRPFFDAIAKPHLFLKNDRLTLFWAPTWSYPHFDRASFAILDAIPAHFQVLVKLHPFMYRLFPDEIVQLQEKYSQSDQVLFLDEIPLIYPLIQTADIYLGDSSSVAYDFLALNRPLFLCGEEAYPWATQVQCWERLFLELEQPDTLAERRRAAYEYCYES